MASLCLILSCHKSDSKLSNKGAGVALSNGGKSNSTPNAPDVTANAPDNGAAKRDSLSAPAAGSPRAPQQAFSFRLDRTAERVAAVRRRAVRASAPVDDTVDSESETVVFAAMAAPAVVQFSLLPDSSSSSDPAELIEQASQLIRLAPSTWSVGKAEGGPDPREIYYRLAATTAQKGVELLKQQPQPTEAVAKDKYMSTLLTGLSVRAEALGLLAANVEHAEGSAAETAYREYLAAESNELKRVSAEHKLASMLYRLKELDKAKNAYESLLARDANDVDALAALVRIHREIATAEKAAGKDSEAAANSQLATLYSDRLSEVTSKRNTRPVGVTVLDEEKVRFATRPENVNSDRARPKTENTEGNKARRRP
jgi:hypothetical protein